MKDFRNVLRSWYLSFQKYEKLQTLLYCNSRQNDQSIQDSFKKILLKKLSVSRGIRTLDIRGRTRKYCNFSFKNEYNLEYYKVSNFNSNSLTFPIHNHLRNFYNSTIF